MIKLTRLDGRAFVLNAELIETFEATPETVITLIIDKKRVVVRESVDEVLEKIAHYKRFIFSSWPVRQSLPANELDPFSESEESDLKAVAGHPYLSIPPEMR